MKILFAFCCFTMGLIVTTYADEKLLADDMLNPVFLGFGFVIMLVAGLYGFLKVVRPLIY